MRIAVIGSRSLKLGNLEEYLPACVEEIISGGAEGIDACARAFATAHAIPYREYLPMYRVYGRAAPLKRNEQIVEQADMILAYWDGKSRGTKYSITYAVKIGKKVRVIRLPETGEK